VTGGARGLGAAIAAAAMEDGYRVGAVDIDVDGVPARPEQETFAASITDEESVEELLDRFGTPDVLVNNAGIVRFGPLPDLTTQVFRDVVEVNLVGTFVMARAIACRWIAAGRSGVVVNTTSMSGVAAGPNAGSYGASKADVAMLTSQMALEWGHHGIRVDAVAPGLIDAGMSEVIHAEAATHEARRSKVPLGRLGAASDIADMVLFFALDRASNVHGQNIVVDGGVTGSIIAHLRRPASLNSVRMGE